MFVAQYMMNYELQKKFFKVGKVMTFLYSGDKSSPEYARKYSRADGANVTIIRPLYEEEDGDATSLYLVKVPNGGLVEAFEDELCACSRRRSA